MDEELTKFSPLTLYVIYLLTLNNSKDFYKTIYYYLLFQNQEPKIEKQSEKNIEIRDNELKFMETYLLETCKRWKNNLHDLII